MAILDSKILQDAQTSISTGETISVYEARKLSVSVSGNSSSFTVVFEGSIDGNNYFPVLGYKKNELDGYSTSTSKLNEGWDFEVDSLVSFRANLIAIGDGNITVAACITK
jgi:hypothetical protein